MRPAKVAAIAAGCVVVVLLIVALSQPGGPRSISGTYELYVAGRDSGTRVVITEHRGRYEINMRGAGDLEADFTVAKARDNQYVLESASGGKATARYLLTASDKGLSGSATILPVGSVDVFFKKVK
ncbi:hypothetical protein [Salinispira pacifica]